MGWYRVVKTIKGHRYIYEQRTWREGKRVRTESRYIGAAVNTTLPDGRNPSAVVEEAFTDLMKPYPPQYHWTHGWASNPMREKPLEHIVEVDKFIAGLKLKRTS